MGQFVAEVGASRAEMTGERAFHSGDQNFRLGIPLTATITPVEVTGGYRFPYGSTPAAIVAAGVVSYGYTETSDFADPSENVDTRQSGFVLNGGFEFRLHRWVGASADGAVLATSRASSAPAAFRSRSARTTSAASRRASS